MLAAGEPTEAGRAVARPRPAWVQALADRAAGRPSDRETLEAVQRGTHRPRTESEQRLLARLGFEDGHVDEPPPAA
jgi:hypothetical protein